jgi:hypothetical protein
MSHACNEVCYNDGSGDRMTILSIKRNFTKAVEKMVETGHPMERKATLERLIAGGFSRSQGMEKIAEILLEETVMALDLKKSFNTKKFIERIRVL